MSTGGRIMHHEMMYLSDARNAILFVGYQAVGTFGRLLSDGAKSVTMAGNPISVQARVETIFGYSSHKDSDHLVEFVATAGDTLRRVFVVMGEPKASLFLVQKLRDNLGIDAIYPEKGRGYGV
jgi:metallo-beta-lactamase family protein